MTLTQSSRLAITPIWNDASVILVSFVKDLSYEDVKG